MSAKWCGDGTVCQWELTMERFMDPCRDLCGFLPSDFSKPPWWTEQVCKHPPLAAFLASVATAVDFCQAISACRSGGRNRYANTHLWPLSWPPSRPLWIFYPSDFSKRRGGRTRDGNT